MKTEPTDLRAILLEKAGTMYDTRYSIIENMAHFALPYALEVERLKAENKWTPVSDRLPETTAKIYVTVNIPDEQPLVVEGFYMNGEYHGTLYEAKYITAWMYKRSPEPFKHLLATKPDCQECKEPLSNEEVELFDGLCARCYGKLEIR